MTRSDIRALVWIRLRHLRTWFVFWMRAAGADAESGGLLERMYIAYIVIIAAGWAFAMWVMVLAQVAEVFASLPAEATAALGLSIAGIPLAVMAMLATRALRTSPLKFSSPDIAYVAAGSAPLQAIYGLEVAWRVARAGVLWGLGGYIAGVGLKAAGTGALPGTFALVACLVAIAVTLASWLVGVARSAAGSRAPRWLWLAAWPVAIVAGIARVLVPGLDPFGAALAAAATGSSVGAYLAVVSTAAAGLAVAVIYLAGRADMRIVIDESGLYAELQAVRLLSRFDPAAYREIVRRKRLARRRPWPTLPLASGRAAPVSRATLSYARQPGRLPSLLVWGGIVVPAGAFLVAHHVGVMLYLPWLAFAISGASRELTRVFADDIDRPAIRHTLPFPTLELLLLDSLPAIVVAIAASAVVVPFVIGSGASILGALVLCALLTLLAVLCGGIGMVERPGFGRPLSFEMSMLVASAVVVWGGIDGGVWEAALAAAIATGIAVMLVSSGREHGV